MNGCAEHEGRRSGPVVEFLIGNIAVAAVTGVTNEDILTRSGVRPVTCIGSNQNRITTEQLPSAVSSTTTMTKGVFSC